LLILPGRARGDVRLTGLILMILAVACALLPPFREAIPFRIALTDHQAIGAVIVCGLAGVVALVGDRL
jgi:hypothetical protein